MKIIYDAKENMYLVKVEYPETEIWINTSDITKARVEFIECMAREFDATICEKLKDNPIEYLETKVTNQICQSDFDHEWECCGMSTAGSDYVCKKCYAHKFIPYETSSFNYYKGE